jgi:glycosyltransferase involved in cell wall biosynthesis
MNKKISIIIPVFNNQDSLELLHTEIVKIFKENSHIEYQIIFVDDCSNDNSREILKKINKINPKVTLIFLTNNYGQGPAVKAGFDNADGDYFVTIDADLQDPPEIILKMLKYATEDRYDLIIAARSSNENNIIRNFYSFFSHLIIKIIVNDYPKGGFNSWLMNKKFFKLYMQETNAISQADVLKIGLRRKIIFYKKLKRLYGSSQYKFTSLFNIFFNLIMDSFPNFFKKFFILGVIIFIFSVINIFVLLFNHFILENSNPKGTSAILTYISFFGGLNLLFLGMCGSYIIKIYENLNKKEKYHISKIIKNNF